MIELPDFVTSDLIERTHRRAQELKRLGERHPVARQKMLVGMNMARARYPKMLLFLEKATDHLQRMSDAQQERLRYAEDGRSYAKSEFSEAATWRTAYEKASEPSRDEAAMFRTWGWIYAAVAEALGA